MLSLTKTVDGDLELFTLQHGRLTVQCSNYGATILSVLAPDREGVVEEVSLNFASAHELRREKGGPYYGCVAGRVANRIKHGRFTLDGQEHRLAVNNDVNHLHGGVVGFNQRLWRASEVREQDKVGVLFQYLSADGEEGYPGNLNVTVGYYLTAKNDLEMTYHAVTDAPTIVNLTNHTYWNLSGGFKEKIYDHHLQLSCSRYLPVDDTQIPTGELRDVRMDPLFDFTGDGRSLRESVQRVDGGGRPGLDHTFVVDKCEGENEGELRFVGRLSDAVSGRALEVHTTQPGVQIYTGNWLEGEFPHTVHNALCLETQHFPDSVNQPSFPSVVLRAGEEYNHRSVFRFRIV